MSTVTASVAEILPNLPGYRVKDQPMTIRPVSFEVVDGHMFTRDNALPLLGPGSGTGLGGQGAGGTSTFVPGGLEENSMSSIGSLSYIT
jgi:hypothetical protein